MNAKNFLHGFGSILNIFPADDTRKITLPHKSDEEALRSDWEAVGEDLSTSINKNKDLTGTLDKDK